MLKAALRKQELRKQNHVVNSVLEHVKKRVEECKKRCLRRYDVPLIIMGYPRYDIYELYDRLKKEYEKDENMQFNIMDSQIVIEWEKPVKNKHQEINKILEEINQKIELFIDNDFTETVYDIPVLIEGVPLYNYEKTVERIVKFLTEEGFFIVRLSKTQIGISWKKAKIIRKKPKKENKSKTIVFKEPNYEKSLDKFESKLDKLKRKTQKFNLG